MPSLRHLLVDLNSTTFANPEDATHTLRFIRRANTKKAGTQSLTGITSSIRSVQRLPVPLPEGCKDCTNPYELVSIKTEISGSRENAAAMVKIIDTHIANLLTARADLLIGFLPPVSATFVSTK